MGQQWFLFVREAILPILGIIILAATTTVSGDACTDQIEACHKPLLKYHNVTHFAIFDAESDTELDEICIVYKDVKECVATIMHHCPSLTRRQYEGYDAVYEYICNEGKDTYLKIRLCLRKPDLVREAYICNTTFQHNLKTIGYYSKNVLDKLKKTCTYVETYLSCVHLSVDDHCGGDAADWQQEVDKRALEPLMEEVGCNMDRQSKTYTWLPVAVILPVVIAVAAASFCIIMHMRKDSKQRQRQSQQRAQRHQAHNAAYSPGGEGTYPVVNLGVGAAGGAGAGTGYPEKGKGGELPPNFLQLPPYMNDPPPDYVEIAEGARSQAGGYAPSEAGRSERSHKSKKSSKSKAAGRPDDLESVASAPSIYPQSVRSHHSIPYENSNISARPDGYM